MLCPLLCTSTLFEPYQENDLDMSVDFDLSIENYNKFYSTTLYWILNQTWFDATLV